MTFPLRTAASKGRSVEPVQPAKRTRRLLVAGAGAGPAYVLVAVAQMLGRDGFDPRIHAVSLLANGDWGWVQTANFLLAGLLTIAGAIGIRRALPPGPGRRWGPRLLGVYGVSLLGAGIFTADPAGGFPPGTPAGPPATLTWHATAHFAAGGVGFLAFVAACLVLARRFAALSRPGWTAFSAATGTVFLAAFAVAASATPSAATNLAFALAVLLAWAWFTALALSLTRFEG